MIDDTTTTASDTNVIGHNDDVRNMDSVLDAKVKDINVEAEQPSFAWSENVPESIKAEFKSPDELAKAYGDLKENTAPAEKYDYKPSTVVAEYVDAMQGVMKEAKLSKTQGESLLQCVEKLEQTKLDANCKTLTKMHGSEDQLVEKLASVAPIIKDKFGEDGEKILLMLKQTQYDPSLVNFVFKTAESFKTDRHISGNAVISNAKDEIQKKWRDPVFMDRYRRNDKEAIQEIDSLYNKIYN